MDTDSSSDYGYDLTAEDEAALSQLIDAIPERIAPLPSLVASDDEDAAASPPALAYLRSGFRKKGQYATSGNAQSAQAGQLAAGGPNDEGLAAAIPGLARAIVASGDAGTTAFVEDTKPRTLPSIEPAAIVRYPDCKLMAPSIRIMGVSAWHS
jgi:hypothetical protein